LNASKFELSGYLEASSELSLLKRDLEVLIEEANKSVLQRGVPAGAFGARVVKWHLRGRVLSVRIEGTRFVTAHDAIKRLKNFLTDRLEEKKVGLRKIFIDRYVMEVDAAKERVGIVKEYEYVKKVEVLDGRAKITLESIDEATLDRGDIHRLMKFIAPEVRTIKRELSRRVGLILERSARKKVRFSGDVTETALKLGWIKRFPGRGQWYYMPQYATLQTALKDLLIEKISRPLGFVEILLPKLLPIEVAFTAKKIQGEPGGMFYVCPPRVRDKDEYIPLQVKAEITGELPMEELEELLEKPGYVLDPAQCTPFYQLYRNKTVRDEDMPIKVYEYGGPTYRYEAGGVKGMERLCEFWRVEHIWLGTPKMVEDIRTELMRRSTEIVDKYLDLEWRMQFAGDTFYLAEDQKIDEDVEIPEAPKYEWQFYLPYKGPRNAEVRDVWLACGSFNSHGSHYTKHFNIKSTSGEVVWTGCFGIGMTRLITAFLSQHGFSFDDWPSEVKKRVGQISGAPEPV